MGSSYPWRKDTGARIEMIDRLRPPSGEPGWPGVRGERAARSGVRRQVQAAIDRDGSYLGAGAIKRTFGVVKITATVPSRATTGPIEVTAAGGSFTTTAKFKVT
jgi:hypothetical protein